MPRVLGYVSPVGETRERERDEANQLGAINKVVERRQWDLRATVVDTDGNRWADVLGAMNAGEADILLFADIKGWRGPEPGLSLARVADRGGWRVVCATSGFEQGTELAARLLATHERTLMVEPLDAEVPLPPADLRRRVTGGGGSDGFIRRAQLDVQIIRELLHSVGRPLSPGEVVLDFGCGCGRTLGVLRAVVPAITVVGADTDAEAAEWVRVNTGAEVHDLPELPPTDLEAERFDVALAISVFTHLDEDHQDAWLAELHRTIRPGGLLIATLHLGTALQWHTEHPLIDFPPDTASLLAEHGIAFWRDDGWDAIFADWYHTTHHSVDYVRRHWARWFEVIDIWPAAMSIQDLVALRRVS